MDKISDRDKTKIREAIADKLVDKICDALIEGKPLTGNLRETLGNTMTNVLNEPDNKSKITQTIFQSVDSALKMPLQGPLLLFSLVNNNQSYSYIQNYITMIFSKVYNENDTIKLFNKRLYDQLSEPPYESWFSQISQQGGKKRKTKRKTKHIRKQRGGMAIPAGVAGLATGFVNKNTDTLKKVAKETVEETKGNLEKMAKDTVTNDNKDDLKPETKKTRKEMSFSERVKDDFAQGQEKMSKLRTKLETDLGANGVNMRSLPEMPGMPGMPGMPSFGMGKKIPEMTGGEIDQTADDLIVKFGSSLIENITTDIPTISPQILQRMLNASYIHAIKNGDQLVDSANNTLANTIKSTPLIRDIFPVILVQALYNSGKYVMESLAQTFQQQKKDARDKGGNDDITFKPTDPNFVIIFMGKLKENISERINMG